MYKINPAANRIEPLQTPSFKDLGLSEVQHLQEWIAHHPACLGEKLLIIQKEFDGFQGTWERLDLLALDKRGSLVFIENKLDDSGKGVTWQALKYASYCSRLSKDDIRKIYQDYLDGQELGQSAEARLVEFLGDGREYEDLELNQGASTQRIMLVAAHFRKEVTSTVLWLLNFRVRMQCFRATPYQRDEDLFLGIEQIIPTPDAEDYMVGMADKAREEIGARARLDEKEAIRKEFWERLVKAMNDAGSDLYQDADLGHSNWLGAKTGMPGVNWYFTVSKQGGRVELYFDVRKEEVRPVFDSLLAQKDRIERDFGEELIWENFGDKQSCKVCSRIPGNVYDKRQWDAMVPAMRDGMLKLQGAAGKPLRAFREGA